MATDRSVREARLAALLAFMRGEITSREFDGRVRPPDSRDRTASRVYRMLRATYDDFVGHAVHACIDKWQTYQRIAVFLKSDLEPAIMRRRVRSRRRLYALVGLCVLVAGPFASCKAGSPP